MQKIFKNTVFILIFIFTAIIMDSCKSRGPYNPYVHLKRKPNEIQMRADKKTIKKNNRIYKRQMGTNRKHVFGRRKPPTA